jgi:hypothetical protein
MTLIFEHGTSRFAWHDAQNNLCGARRFRSWSHSNFKLSLFKVAVEIAQGQSSQLICAN